MNPTKMLPAQPKVMLKVKTHLKAGQGACPDPGKAYSDGYNSGYSDSRDKGPKHDSHHSAHHHDNSDWWWS